jgi:phage shock protein A
LDQELREAKKELQVCDENLTKIMAKRKLAENKVNALNVDIETYTNHAIAANEKGDEALAIECAERVADHEANLETELSILNGFLSSEKTLKANIAKAKTNVRRMEQQIDQVKATESVQKAQVAVSTRHLGANSKVKTALDSLERIKAKQEQRSAELAAADELANEESGSSLDAKLKAAGIQPGGQVRGNDKLAQILAAKKG